MLAAIGAATWLALAEALQQQPPVAREILIGGAIVGLLLFLIIGGLAIIEARALRRADQRMRRFLADASHELRTPIAGIQASAETLLRTDPSRPGREKLVLQILREAHRAGRLVEDLLTMTRLEQGTPLDRARFDLVPLAAAAVEVTQELAPQVDVQLHSPDQSPIRGDAQRIRQVLDNLLSNARHATPNGGQIIICISNHNDEVQVEVIDSGPGVPRPDRERIFERFVRLPDAYEGRHGGNGLGLAIARGIARAHSGTLTCADPADHGARFLLRLPRRD